MIGRATAIATMAALCSACTTVNLQSMAGPSGNDVVEIKSEANVVQRAVERLKAAFTSRGFGPKSSEKKMHAAADMLLNGMARHVSQSEDGGYSEQVRPVSVVLDDAHMANRHVEQTYRAAEVYLDVASDEEDLTEELQSLQAALIASDRAVILFDKALPDHAKTELSDLRISVDKLRLVTDRFGDRVRTMRLQATEDEATLITG